ncbi:hypothetical protein V8E53_001012 [Lactarius tabidus]
MQPAISIYRNTIVQRPACWLATSYQCRLASLFVLALGCLIVTDVLGSIRHTISLISLYYLGLILFALSLFLIWQLRDSRFMVKNQRENRENSDLNFIQSIIPRSSLSQSQGANDVADHSRSLRGQPHQGLRIPRRQVTTMRVVALASQVMLEARDVMQNIGEMVVLCGELLSSNLSEGAATLLVTLTSYRMPASGKGAHSRTAGSSLGPCLLSHHSL